MDNNTTYKNASVILAGMACLIVVIRFIVERITVWLPYEDSVTVWNWMGAYRLATPILFAWIGILLRKRFPSPKALVKGLLLAIIPASYIMWTILHRNGIYFFGDGDRCEWLYSAILGFLIPRERLEIAFRRGGWIELTLFFAAVFCFVGISRVEDHFGVENYQMLRGEWTRFFCRAMRFIPLAMSLFFLTEFSFSRTGQVIGSRRGVGKTVMVLAVLSFLYTLLWYLTRRFYYVDYLYKIGKVQSQPVAIYLICVIVRVLQSLRGKGRGFWKDIISGQEELSC